MRHKNRIFLVLVHVFFCISLNLSAQERSYFKADTLEHGKTFEQHTFREQSMTSVFFRSFFALFILIAVVYAGVVIIKKFGHGKVNKKGDIISIAGSTYLGPKKSIFLVDIHDKRLVLGVTDTSIQLLTQFDRPEQDAVVEKTGQPGSAAFSSLLNNFMRKRNEE